MREYYYTIGWHRNLINSRLFDQPAAHHNPQRDPFPAAHFYSKNAKIGSTSVDVSLINNEHSSVRGEAHYIDWNPTASPAYNKGALDWLLFWQNRSNDTHYYPTSDLKGYHNSPATQGSKNPHNLALGLQYSRACCRRRLQVRGRQLRVLSVQV